MKRVAPKDTLYAQLAKREDAKLAKLAADLCWSPPDLPREGIEKAFAEMEEEVRVWCQNSGDETDWTFFAKDTDVL